MIFDIIKLILPVIDKVIPDANKRAEAAEQIERTLLANQAALFDGMKSVMAADAASESWLTRNARPIVVMWCLSVISWVVISPAFGLQDATIRALRSVPGDLWNLVSVGIGGYILAKTITDTVKAVKK